MSNKIVSIQDLKREFRMGAEVVRVLKGVTFDVEPGEFVTIMGSSGSGKTTMLNILGCLDKPSYGKYLLDGVDVGSLSRNELAVLRRTIYWRVHRPWRMLSCPCCTMPPFHRRCGMNGR
jgi:putative ABC transport system ATP-binding protein